MENPPRREEAETPLTVPTVVGQGGRLPERQTDGSLHDLYAAEDVRVWPSSKEAVPTGLRVTLPPGTFGDLRSRSGVAFHLPLLLVTGTVDNDFTGEISLVVQNLSNTESVLVQRGDRLAQMAVIRRVDVTFVPVERLGATRRGEGGFGSTGMT